MPGVEPRESGFGCRIGTIGSLVVSVFDSKPELGLLDLLAKVQTEQVAKYGRFSSITVISMPRLEPPAAEFRTRSAEHTKKFQDAIIGTAMVITTTGVAAVVVRSFLAAYALLVTQRSPQQTFRQIAPAVQWLQQLPGQPDDVKRITDLTAAVEAFATLRPTSS